MNLMTLIAVSLGMLALFFVHYDHCYYIQCTFYKFNDTHGTELLNNVTNNLFLLLGVWMHF